MRGDSVSALARGAAEHLLPLLDRFSGPWLLHAFVPDPRAYRSIAARAALIADELLADVRARRQAILKRLQPQPGPAPFTGHLLVQLCLVGRGSLLVSAAQPRPLPTGGFNLAPWPAGSAPVPEDRQAPSRAYRKLVEGFAWLGLAPGPGERCVDLGGAPGGWAHTALKRGAQVVAVDRSPLVPPAAGHPGLQVVLGDAFAYRPAAPVDWLLCDVICQPGRTIDLVESWMRAGLCRRVVATLKFTGTADYAAVERARARLGAVGWPFLRFKHLRNHHNEVAILASAGAGSGP